MKLPFAVNRNLSINLSDQLADGLRQAIVSGYYRKGEMLPKLSDMATALGVSMRVPREAIAKLAAEGFVSPRQRIGCEVLGRRESFWRGQILAIASDRGEGSFHASTMLGEMRRQFTSAGYLFSTVAITRLPHGGCDMAHLDLVLRQKFDFVFPLFCPAATYRHLDAMGVRWATVEGVSGGSPTDSFLGSLAPFISQCRSKGVRKVLLAGYGSLTLYQDLRSKLVAAGLEIESHRSHAIDSPTYLETLERGSMRYFMRRFRQPRETWPDLVLWEDDFLAYIKSLDEKKPVIFCGDLNVAHQEIDLKNPKTNRKNAGFTDEEREKMTVVLSSGFTDTWRSLNPDVEGVYSWWSYRFSAREKNAGWRIDYFIVSDRITDKIEDAKIHTEVFGSDHCPVELDMKF